MNETTKKERFTTYLPTDLIEHVKELSDKTKIPQARLFERAVERFMTEVKEDISILFEKE